MYFAIFKHRLLFLKLSPTKCKELGREKKRKWKSSGEKKKRIPLPLHQWENAYWYHENVPIVKTCSLWFIVNPTLNVSEWYNLWVDKLWRVCLLSGKVESTNARPRKITPTDFFSPENTLKNTFGIKAKARGSELRREGRRVEKKE